MLLVGAFYGRAGGLILLGLLATVATTGATVASQVDGGQMDERPTSAAAVQDEYSLDTGEVVVDLSDVRDVEALDGRSIEVHTGIGRVEVILPAGSTSPSTAGSRAPATWPCWVGTRAASASRTGSRSTAARTYRSSTWRPGSASARSR